MQSCLYGLLASAEAGVAVLIAANATAVPRKSFVIMGLCPSNASYVLDLHQVCHRSVYDLKCIYLVS